MKRLDPDKHINSIALTAWTVAGRQRDYVAFWQPHLKTCSDCRHYLDAYNGESSD